MSAVPELRVDFLAKSSLFGCLLTLAAGACSRFSGGSLLAASTFTDRCNLSVTMVHYK